MTDKELMLAGKLYIAGGEELAKDFKKSKQLTREYNQTTHDELEKRTQILKELLGSMGEDVYIEPTFKCAIFI